MSWFIETCFASKWIGMFKLPLTIGKKQDEVKSKVVYKTTIGFECKCSNKLGWFFASIYLVWFLFLIWAWFVLFFEFALFCTCA